MQRSTMITRQVAMRLAVRISRIVALVAALVAALVTVPAITATSGVHASVAVVSVDVADAGDPSITSDGRWIVFTGRLGERRSVFRTDRHTGDTVELSPVPATVQEGDTIKGRISPNGCVVVALTEVAFDLFRDDDRDDRWDVYRLVVPECGGQVNGWELVSSSSRTGTALDGVFIDSAPALSGSGALVAYTHQAPGTPEGVSTISVVDITKPINEPGRVQTVAGMPVEAPNRAFLYRGATHPALSQNGRHLAFVSDTTASEALPGWAEGQVLGEYGTPQVYVWDRGVDDQRRAVRLVSGVGDVRSVNGAGEPDISEDGRIVVFTSSDRSLVTAELPGCTTECPTQVYRFDRDTDGNGIFDEPPRTSPLSLVSAVDAGVVDVGVPVAGNDASWAPAVNEDGSQVGFVTDATNLLASHRAGGGDVRDGDLLIAEVKLGQIRRVIDGSDDTDVPGAHGNPALSKTGEVIAFDTMAAGSLTGVQRATSGGQRSVATVVVRPQLSLASLDFGTVLLGFESAELYARVLNAGPGAFEPSVVETSLPNFKVTGGTCTRGIVVAAGESCSVNLTFNPTEQRGFTGTLTVRGYGANAPSATTTIHGAAGEPTLLAEPGGVDLDPGVVGGVGGRVAIDIANIGFFPTQVTGIQVSGAHADDFHVVTQSCTNRALNPDASCTIEVEFRPTGGGYRSALLIAAAPFGEGLSYTTAILGGFATYEPSFDSNFEVVRPGSGMGVGGSGFPAQAPVSIGFDDGGAPFATVTTNDDGAFLAVVTVPGRLRARPRNLVATAPGGVVATWPIEILVNEVTATPHIPGYGLG